MLNLNLFIFSTILNINICIFIYMRTFNYRTLSYTEAISDTTLKSLGRQGWEMCGFAYQYEKTEPYIYYFKREI